MSTKISKIFIRIAVITMLAMAIVSVIPAQSVSASTLDRGGSPGGGTGGGQGGVPTGSKSSGQTGIGIALTPLADTEKTALSRAILEEYGAFNLYQSVTAKFGNVAPFALILRAEQQHINALKQQASKYGVSVPVNPGLANPPLFNTLAEACQAGVTAEIADAALYDQLKPSVTHSDILKVFTNLKNASLNSHLPAFTACK